MRHKIEPGINPRAGKNETVLVFTRARSVDGYPRYVVSRHTDRLQLACVSVTDVVVIGSVVKRGQKAWLAKTTDGETLYGVYSCRAAAAAKLDASV